MKFYRERADTRKMHRITLAIKCIVILAIFEFRAAPKPEQRQDKLDFGWHSYLHRNFKQKFGF